MIYCCGCKTDVEARLVTGEDVYPHRRDLYNLPFWRCPACGNFVGCHHKTKDRTKPLGVIPTPEIKNARKHIHRILDPLWGKDKKLRVHVYAEIARKLGVEEYHTAEIRSIEEARKVWKIIKAMQ